LREQLLREGANSAALTPAQFAVHEKAELKIASSTPTLSSIAATISSPVT
jgi:hypothetical protein